MEEELSPPSCIPGGNILYIICNEIDKTLFDLLILAIQSSTRNYSTNILWVIN